MKKSIILLAIILLFSSLLSSCALKVHEENTASIAWEEMINNNNVMVTSMTISAPNDIEAILAISSSSVLKSNFREDPEEIESIINVLRKLKPDFSSAESTVDEAYIPEGETYRVSFYESFKEGNQTMEGRKLTVILNENELVVRLYIYEDSKIVATSPSFYKKIDTLDEQDMSALRKVYEQYLEDRL